MKEIYQAKMDVANSSIGQFSKGDKFNKTPQTDDLYHLGYLAEIEYNTKTVVTKPKANKKKQKNR